MLKLYLSPFTQLNYGKYTIFICFLAIEIVNWVCKVFTTKREFDKTRCWTFVGARSPRPQG